jgi:GTPase SAR1 family protein
MTETVQSVESSAPEQRPSLDTAKAENDKLLLAQALQRGSKEWKRSKLSLLGQGRAGKTAFANAVAGRQFEETASTVGINQLTCDVKQMRLGDTGQAQWSEEVKADREYETALAGMVARSKLEPSAEGVALQAKGDIRAYMQAVMDSASHTASTEQEEASAIDDPVMDSPEPVTSLRAAASSPAKLRAEVTQARTSAPLQASVVDAPPQANQNRKVRQEPRSTEKNLKVAELDEEMVMKLLATMQDADTGLLISLFDFGGQSVFEVIHHLFLTRNGVYALVFNMEWLVAEGPERDKALRFMRNWLSSIAVHTYNKTIALTAPIVIVGTRLDKVASPTDHEKISTLLHEQFSDNLAWQSVVGNEQGRDSNGRAFQWFFPVDNVAGRTGPTMQHLMSVVQGEIDKAEYTHKEVPLTWFKAIDQMGDTKKDCLTLTEVVATAGTCGVSEQEAPLMLSFLHDMGHLMWLDEPGLRDVVILDPVSYLVTPATIIICKLTPDHEDTIHHCLASHRECERRHKRAWSQLTHEGVLSVQLLPILWEKYQEHSVVLLQLMVKFGLLVPLHGDAAGPVTQYLVPTLLTPASPEDAFIVNWTNADYSTCYFVFTLSPDLSRSSTVTDAELRAAGFLPGGMFERIVGKALSWSQDTSVDAAIDLQSVILHKDVAVLAFGRQRFRLVNCADIHCVRVDVEGAHPIGVQQKLQNFMQRIIDECMKSLLCFCAVPFLSAAVDNAVPQSSLRKTLLPNELLIPLSQLRRASKGESMLVRKGQHTLLTEAEIAKKYGQWLQLYVLRDRYDAFLSYRWGRYDSEFTEQLFDMFTNFPLGEQNRAVEVFLDRKRLQDGRLFKSDFAKALTHSLVVVPVVSVDALARMVEHNPSQPDNVLLEWVMILESHTAGRVLKVFPILFGQRKTQDVGAQAADGSAGPAAFTVADFFAEKVQDTLPVIAPTATVAVAAELLRENGIEPSEKMQSYTVHSVVHAMLQFLLCKANDFPARRLVGDFAKKVVRLLHDCGSAAMDAVVTEVAVRSVAAEVAQAVTGSAKPQSMQPSAAAVNSRALVSLSVEEVVQALTALQMDYLAPIFAEKRVTGTLLDCCDTVDDLMTDDFGVTSRVKAKALMKHIEGWRANGVSGL